MIRLQKLGLAAVLALTALAPKPAFAAETFSVAKAADPVGLNPFGSIVEDTDGSFVVITDAGGIGRSGSVARVKTDGTVTTLGSFFGANGSFPLGGVMKASDGNFYGTTLGGGTQDLGTVFQVSASGSLKKLANLAGKFGQGPESNLVEMPDGLLYGTARTGGASNRGTIFKVSKTGAISLVHSFAGADGSFPSAGLTKGTDGNLWGVTTQGSAADKGVVYKVTPAGVFSVTDEFSDAKGFNARAALTLGSDGVLYGVCTGASQNLGSVFKLSTEGKITQLAAFTAAVGGYPFTPLTESSTAGEFYGITAAGGTAGQGVVYKVTSAGVLTKVADSTTTFQRPANGPLLRATNGKFYGLAAFGGQTSSGQLFELAADGTATTVASFGVQSGIGFTGPLARGAGEELFGVSADGGTNGAGVFYRITTGGVYTALSSFDPAVTGRGTYSGIVAGADGNYYGVTTQGPEGAAVFKATPTGTLSKVAALGGLFTTPATTGRTVSGAGGLLLAPDGALYGSLTYVVNNAQAGGVVYKVDPTNGDPSKILSVVVDSAELKGAGQPLIIGADGAIYGTTANGGDGAGTVFRVTSTGDYRRVAAFSTAIGSFPIGRMALGRDNSLYGLTSGGGLVNAGVVFKVTPAGKLSQLTSFNGFNGAFPQGGLVVGPGGSLYGTTSAGSLKGKGTLFKVSLGGKISVLKEFDGATTGAFPSGELTLGSDANFYATTYHTIYRVELNNLPPVLKDDAFELPVFDRNVLKNDKDPDKDPLEVISVTNGSKGTVQLNPNGTLSYLPGPAFTDSDTFTYTVSDGFNPPVSATVTVKSPLDPLKAGVGAYAGIIYDPNNVPVGYWGVLATKSGLVTGAIRLNGVRYTARGLIVNDTLVLTVPSTKTTPQLTINATVDPARNLIDGTLSDGAKTYSLELERTFPLFTAENPPTVAGRYTVLLPVTAGAVGDPALPQGTGYATLNVTRTGLVSMAGKLPDGTHFATGSLISRDNSFPLYLELYGKPKGYVAGLVEFAQSAGSVASAPLLQWVKKPSSTPYFPNGFLCSFDFRASLYHKPNDGKPVLPFKVGPNNATLDFLNANTLGSLFTKTLTVTSKNLVKVENPAAEKLSMGINATTGIFGGTFIDPTDGIKRPFGGAVFQLTNEGAGVYTSKTNTGVVKLQVVP